MSEIIQVDPYIIKIPERRARSKFAWALKELQYNQNIVIPFRAELDAFINNVKLNGIMEPVSLRKEEETGNLWLSHGESRVRAAILLIFKKEVSWTTIPARIIGTGGEKEASLDSLSTCVQGETDIVSLAYFVSDLIDSGVSVVEIAKRLGRDEKYVYELQAVAHATTHIQTLVSAGELGIRHVYHLRKIEDKDVMEKVADIARKGRGNWTERETFQFVEELKKKVESGMTWVDAYKAIWEEKTTPVKTSQVCIWCGEAKEGKKLTMKRFHEGCWERAKILRDKSEYEAKCEVCGLWYKLTHKEEGGRIGHEVEYIRGPL